jgi:hypothetical protein
MLALAILSLWYWSERENLRWTYNDTFRREHR